MILTEEQAKERLNSGRNLLNRFGKVEEVMPTVDVIEMPHGGGHAREIDKETKIAIAARARMGEQHKALAAEFGVTRQTVSYLHRPQFGRGKLDETKVEDKMSEVQDVAMCRLLSSLGFLDDTKLSKLGAKELSAVAANMAKVVGNTRAQEKDPTRVTVQLFAPELRKETSYKVLEVTSV